MLANWFTSDPPSFVVMVLCGAPQVLHKRVPCRTQEQSLFLTAVENTWIHGRQKRREQNRQLRELPRAPHCAGTSSQTSLTTAAPGTPTSSQNQPDPAANTASQDDNVRTTLSSTETRKEETRSPAGELKEVMETAAGETGGMECSTSTETGQEPDLKDSPTQPVQSQIHGPVEHFLFKCVLNVIPEQRDVVVELHWVEGQNKDLMNQLRTYLRNTLCKSGA